MELSSLISPYGGKLLDLLVQSDDFYEVKAHASCLPSLRLSERAACDMELLAVGAFSPLDRFMGRSDYQRVLHEMRLGSGHLFPIPITLPIEADFAPSLEQDIALRDAHNELLAVMTIHEVYEWDLDEMAALVLG